MEQGKPDHLLHGAGGNDVACSRVQVHVVIVRHKAAVLLAKLVQQTLLNKDHMNVCALTCTHECMCAYMHT